MSKYTTELRNIIDSPYFDIVGDALTEYDIFDPDYRELLNKKILDHYRFHEIGFETGERFIYELNRKMIEIMPYYNKLYSSELLAINPLINFKRSITENKTSNTTSSVTDALDSTVTLTDTNQVDVTKTVTQDDDRKVVGSNTPQTVLLSGEINGDTYATQAEVSQTDFTATDILDENTVRNKTDVLDQDRLANASSDVTETKTVTHEGFEDTSMSELIIKHRKTLLNIDMLVIERLRPLFMLIY